jgi:lipopolysaccharide export system ATP-binding protein
MNSRAKNRTKSPFGDCLPFREDGRPTICSLLQSPGNCRRYALIEKPHLEITTDNLVKAYHGRNVVDGVSFHVKQGEVVGLLGPNGAGKTTSFYMVVGLVKPRTGRVMLDQQDITRLPMYKRARMGIGYLAQEPSVFRKLTVAQNIMLVLELMPLTSGERHKRLDALLGEFEIADKAGQIAQSLSGGERRRLEIARSLATEPKFILLDEPFTGVDPLAIQSIQEHVRTLKERGIGVLITDHNVRETLAITDRSYIMSTGKIVTAGSSEDLVNDPVAKKFYLGDQFSI